MRTVIVLLVLVVIAGSVFGGDSDRTPRQAPPVRTHLVVRQAPPVRDCSCPAGGVCSCECGKCDCDRCGCGPTCPGDKSVTTKFTSVNTGDPPQAPVASKKEQEDHKSAGSFPVGGTMVCTCPNCKYAFTVAIPTNVVPYYGTAGQSIGLSASPVVSSPSVTYQSHPMVQYQQAPVTYSYGYPVDYGSFQSYPAYYGNGLSFGGACAGGACSGGSCGSGMSVGRQGLFSRFRGR